MDGQEIAGVVEAGDQRQLRRKQRLDLGRDAQGITDRRMPPGQLLEPALGIPARGHRLIGIFIGELVERELDPRQQGFTLGQSLGAFGKEPRHLGRRLQMALGIHFEAAARLLDGHPLADAAHHILQVPLGRGGIEHIIGGQQGHAGLARHGHQPGQATAIIPPAMLAGPQPERPRRGIRQRGQGRRHAIETGRRQQDQQQVARIGQQVRQNEMALTLLRPAFAQREKPAEPPPAGAVGGIGHHIRRAIGKAEPRPHHQPEAGGARHQLFGRILRIHARQKHIIPRRRAIPQLERREGAGFAQIPQGGMGAYNPGHGVAIGNAQPGLAQPQGLQQHVRRR